MRSVDDPPLGALSLAPHGRAVVELESPCGIERFARDSRVRLVEESLAVHVHGVLSPSHARAWTDRVLAARADYTHAFGTQASLGVAWYTHLEEGHARAYFASAKASDACVRRHVPGLQATLLRVVSELLGVKVEPRPGYAGPGVHVFEPHGACAKHGGEVHFDTEGLPEPHVRARGAAYTAVLALSQVEGGGGLRLWDLPFDGYEDPALARLCEPTCVSYTPGDVVLFESYRLHQIEPFTGDTPRVSATCHVARLSGRYVAWF